MESYQISSKTLAIMPINKRKTKIYENDNVIIVDKSANKIISENCEYYGSSYAGRKKGTMQMIGVTHKAPILIQEEENIVFFPTSSPRLHDCAWISVNNLENYNSYDNESLITFNNNMIIRVNASKRIIENQVLRSTRLQAVSSKRRKNISHKNML